uniref:acid phosphatase n=1 Tax=Panagrolaimus davidi TaxID=227884 RepID=A0A914Q334_9BILA
MYVFDTAIFETYLGLPLPQWLIPLMPEFEVLFVNYIATLWGFIPFKEDSFEIDLQKELTKISSGFLIDEIVDRLILKIECQKSKTKNCDDIEKQKFYVYSGHDITEISLLLGLGFKTFIFEKESMPSVGSSIVLELWKSEDNKNISISKENQFELYYVKIYFYQNSSVENPKYIGDLIPECQRQKGCPISYLIKRAELLRPKPDLKSYCNQSVNTAIKFKNSVIIFVSFFVLYYLNNNKY